MNWSDSYNDICNELRILRIHEMEMRKRVELAHEVMVSGEIPSSGSYCHMPLDKAIERFNTAVDDLDRIQEEVDRLDAVKLEMEQVISKLEGLPHVIQYKRIVEGKNYAQIASELGYSEKHLRNVMWSQKDKVRTQSANAS